jgi:hypothetical protein
MVGSAGEGVVILGRWPMVFAGLKSLIESGGSLEASRKWRADM